MELYIPYDLAYGDRPAGKIKPYSTLVFTVEVVGVKKSETAKARPKVTTGMSRVGVAKPENTVKGKADK